MLLLSKVRFSVKFEKFVRSCSLIGSDRSVRESEPIRDQGFPRPPTASHGLSQIRTLSHTASHNLSCDQMCHKSLLTVENANSSTISIFQHLVASNQRFACDCSIPLNRLKESIKFRAFWYLHLDSLLLQ